MLRRSLIGSAVIVVVSAVAATTTGLLFFERTVAKFHPVNTGHELTPVLSGNPQTILIAGSDRRHGERKLGIGSRSDTLILMRIDPGKGIALMSLPRDLKVQIPGHGTDKINAAYTLGGPKLAIKTVKELTGLAINHYVDVSFHGFEEAVNALGCIYTDVDRRYFNDNSGSPYGGGYAAINVRAGYQKLCGQRALEYVRFRHTDTDIVRAARQQSFIREARDQLSTGKLVNKTGKLIDIFARSTASDIKKPSTLRRLLQLGLGVIDKPITQVKFHADLGPSYVTASPVQIQANVRQFLFVRKAKGALAEHTKKTPNARRGKRSTTSSLFDASSSGREQARLARAGVGFPVSYMRKLVNGSSYEDAPRTYTITGRDGHRYRAYRMVVSTGQLGQYYGLEGMSWKDPPVLAHPSGERELGGHKYLLFFNGDRLRVVGWKTDKGVYWISNTLLQSLSTSEMLALARSLKELP